MLNFLPAMVVGFISIILFLLNLIFIPTLIVIFGVIRVILPFKAARHSIDKLIHDVLTVAWMKLNNAIIRFTTKTKWVVAGKGILRRKRKYILVCNHQSWLDILVIHKIFGNKAAMPVFFMKRSLLWSLPIVGFACWLIGCPFIRRVSKSYLKKHPKKKLQDIEATKKLCERFETHPVTIINFLEGTRFTLDKKKKQRSSYRHLLKPKATGFALVVNSMKDTMQEIINVTIIYPQQEQIAWRFCCGELDKIVVHYEVLPITDEWSGDYLKDRAFRVKFQNKLNQMWQEKDELIGSIK